MRTIQIRFLVSAFCATSLVCAGSGCVHFKPSEEAPIPREQRMVALPPYVIESPDILLINTLRFVPRPPYRIEPLDVLLIQVSPTLPGEPISGLFGVDPEGTVNLGLAYGSVAVEGLTLEEAKKVIRRQLENTIKDPKVLVALSQAQSMQQVRGEHLVRPDGTVGLGTYGSVRVTGLTLPEAQQAIENHLGEFLLNPKLSLDVYAYNSKFYYIIADGAGYGQQVVRLPITGKETVLDAISQIAGLPLVSSKRHIWLARPDGSDADKEQIFPIHWNAITQGGSTGTNYQLMAGDRIYVKADNLITLNNAMSKVFTPLERIFGVTLLGTAAYTEIQNAQILSRTQSFNNTAVSVGR